MLGWIALEKENTLFVVVQDTMESLLFPSLSVMTSPLPHLLAYLRHDTG